MGSVSDSLFRCRRHGFEAIASQNYIGAARWCVRALCEHGFQPEDCGNLAFVVFDRCSRATQASCYDRLNAAGFSDVQSSAATYLRLSFEIALGGEDSEAFVREAYLDSIFRPRIKVEPEVPIVFWHVPKCSGTSLNEALSKHFYGRRLTEVWPGYNYRPLVQFLFEYFLDEIPYASSVHLGMDDLPSQVEHFSFTVLRDPTQRCYSMFRQEMSGNRFLAEDEKNWHNYRAYPKYGELWDYREDRDFFSWLQNIPRRLLRRQLSTFSARQNVAEAVGRINKMDYHFFRDIELGSQQELFETLGIGAIEKQVPKDLNVSNKEVPLPEDAGESLRPFLRKEYELIERLAGSRDDI